MCVRLLTESKLDFEIRYRLRVLHVRGACSVRHPSAVRRQPLGRLRFDQGNSRGSRGVQPNPHHCPCAPLCLLGYLTNRPFGTENPSPGDTVHLPSYCSLTVIVSSNLLFQCTIQLFQLHISTSSIPHHSTLQYIDLPSLPP